MSPREVWCNEAQERYVLAIAAGAARRSSARSCERERCPFAVRGRRDRRRPARGARPALRQHAGRHGPAGAARQAAAHDARRDARQRRALRAVRRDGIELAEAVRARAAAPRRRRQDVPGHDRRPHRGRALLARPDGRPVAGAGRRLRDDAARLRRLRGRGVRDRRAHAARGARRPGLRPHGGRRGAHQPRRGAGALALARQALGQLDGGRRRTRRGRRALRHGQRGGARAVPGARHRHPGRQGLDVDAHGVGRTATRRARSSRRCR